MSGSGRSWNSTTSGLDKVSSVTPGAPGAGASIPSMRNGARLPAYVAHCFAEYGNLRYRQVGAALPQVDREEIGARDPVATVVRHAGNVPENRAGVERRAGVTRRAGHETKAGCAALHPPYN